MDNDPVIAHFTISGRLGTLKADVQHIRFPVIINPHLFHGELNESRQCLKYSGYVFWSQI